MQQPEERPAHPSQFRALSRNTSMQPMHRAGDLAGLEPNQIMHILDRNAERYLTQITHPDNQSVLEREKTKLIERNDDFKAWVNDDSHYPEGAKLTIVSRFLEAEAEASPSDDMITHVARRLSKFSGQLQAISDLDGTLTVLNNGRPSYEVHFPGHVTATPLQEADPTRSHWLDTFVSSWRPYLKHAPEKFSEAAEHAQLRDGVPEFFQMAAEQDIKVHVLSASFEPFVTGVINRVPNTDGVHYAAVGHDDVTSTLKDLHIKHAAAQNPNNPALYFGDGSSDMAAIQAEQYVAAYFALKGSSFEAELQDKALPYFPYEDFNDIARTIKELQEKRSQFA